MELSRRTEISIDISSKQVDSLPSPGISRFGLRRPEVSLHNRIPEPGSPRRAEITLSRAQEPLAAYRRADVPSTAARIPEPVQRKAESPCTAESSVLGRQIEPLENRQVETSSLSRESENSFSSEASMTSSFTEYKTPPAARENSSQATDSESMIQFVLAKLPCFSKSSNSTILMILLCFTFFVLLNVTCLQQYRMVKCSAL